MEVFLPFIPFLPVVFSLLIFLFPLALWVVACWLGHVKPVIPYISDLGVIQPEQSLFSLSMSIGAILMLLFTLVRWWLTRAQLRITAQHSVRRQSSVSSSKSLASVNEITIQARVNRANRSLVTGLIITLGFLGVGSFANTNPSNIQTTHNVFASVSFLSVLVDMCFEWRIAVELVTPGIARLRCLIWTLSTIFATTYISTALLSYQANPDGYNVTEKRLQWSSGEPGYELHITSATFELLLVWMLCPYMLSYWSLFSAPPKSNRRASNVAVMA